MTEPTVKTCRVLLHASAPPERAHLERSIVPVLFATNPGSEAIGTAQDLRVSADGSLVVSVDLQPGHVLPDALAAASRGHAIVYLWPAGADAPAESGPPAATKKPSLTEATWEEFATAGLFWWVNRGLHLFGWALVRVVEADGTIARVYPARCRFRGFDEETETDGFRRLTEHMRANADDLAEQVTE